MNRIAMWSGPRSISTALMRSFENRPDTFVTDEPFYAHYLKKTGIDHPFREEIMETGNTDWNSIVDVITGPIPDGKTVWYQKHMAQHNLWGCDLSWTQKFTNCILIRHPRDVILSYAQKYEISSTYQLGYPQQIDLFNMMLKLGIPPLVIDAGDVLKNSNLILNILCEKLGIRFFTEMLSWPEGKRESDGIWGRHWYTSVETSNGFHNYVEKTGNLPMKYHDLFKDCLESYQQLYTHRIQ